MTRAVLASPNATGRLPARKGGSAQARRAGRGRHARGEASGAPSNGGDGGDCQHGSDCARPPAVAGCHCPAIAATAATTNAARQRQGGARTGFRPELGCLAPRSGGVRGGGSGLGGWCSNLIPRRVWSFKPESPGPGRAASLCGGRAAGGGVGGARRVGRRCRGGPESPGPSGPALQGCFGPTAGRAADPLCRAWRCGPRRYAGLRGRVGPLCRNAWAGPGRARHCCGLSRSEGPERAGRRVSGGPFSTADWRYSVTPRRRRRR